jgi:glucosylceramidase
MAPIIADTKNGELTYLNSHYYLGHFSRFIRPGARRIVCSSNNDRLLATAFLNPDHTISIVVLNESNRGMDFKVWLDGEAVQTTSPAHSIITVTLN